MGKGRLEAFSDGVIAIIITIMVLELKTPASEAAHDWSALGPLVPQLLGYVLSFAYVGIYWNNHHHLFHAAKHVSGATLWANLHLLFWLSLVPFVTGWVGESHFAPWPVAAYGIVLLMAGFAWEVLRRLLVACHGKDSVLGVAIGRGAKEWASLAIYLFAVVLAILSGQAADGPGAPWLSRVAFGLYCVVALVWFIPDRRIERAMRGDEAHSGASHG